MSLFDYASKVISEKVQEKSPMLSISMGMEPVMPMAQGGGLSTVQNSLNINGEPHRLAYINPSEESLLQQLGGSGRKIDGIPSYYSTDAEADESNTAANVSGMDSDPSSAEEGIGIGFDTSPAEAEAAVNAAQAEEAAVAAAIGEAEAYSSPQNQAVAPDLGFYGPYSVPEKTFDIRSELSKSKGLSFDIGLGSFLGGLALGPIGAAFGKGLDAALGTSVGVNTGIGAQSMGYGDTGTGTQGGSGQDDNDDDSSTGNDAGGDDIIIKEKIAAVKQVPVEEVTVEEVERAKRLTAEQRVTGTRLEDILDDIYGSGKGAGLLGIATNNTGTA
jgi:hypothetical protein